jgi:hypothetical protein
VGKPRHLDCFICYKGLTPRGDAMSKQHTGAVTIKCPFVKMIKAVQKLVRNKAV